MDLIFCLEWINFWVKLDRICFFIIYFNLIILLFIKFGEVVSLSEWLRSQTWNLVGSVRAGSNPAADASIFERAVSSVVEQLTADQ